MWERHSLALGRQNCTLSAPCIPSGGWECMAPSRPAATALWIRDKKGRCYSRWHSPLPFKAGLSEKNKFGYISPCPDLQTENTYLPLSTLPITAARNAIIGES